MAARSSLLLGLGLALLPAVAVGSTPLPPSPRVFAEPRGVYAFKTLPGKLGKLGACEGVLFTLDAEGKEKAIWRADLVNVPGRAIVATTGGHVVTVDSWGRYGGEHALVVYGDKGKVIADFKLEDLLTAEEIKALVVSPIGPAWSGEPVAAFEDCSREDEFVVRLKHKDWAKTLRVSLSTGKVVRE